MPAIVFDFDGVIADSEPLHEDALRFAARTAGMDFTHERYLAAYVGLDDRDCFAAIAADHGRVLEAEALRALHRAKAERFAALLRTAPVRTFPGVAELARAAAAEGGAAICSGALLSEIAPMLNALGLRGVFGIIVTAESVARAKPDPEGYHLAVARLGRDARDCVAIEDTPKGIAAARAAGLRVLAVTHTLARGELGEADAVVESLAGLLPRQVCSLVGL